MSSMYVFLLASIPGDQQIIRAGLIYVFIKCYKFQS